LDDSKQDITSKGSGKSFILVCSLEVPSIVKVVDPLQRKLAKSTKKSRNENLASLLIL
jgi:hypothetical protein